VIGTNQVERIKAAVTSTSLSLELQDWFSLYEAALGNEVP
jgi:predicted oxidoreductase